MSAIDNNANPKNPFADKGSGSISIVFVIRRAFILLNAPVVVKPKLIVSLDLSF
jgi:hypothetical protein